MNKQNPQTPLQRKDKFTPKVCGKSQESDLSAMVGQLDRNILHRVWFGGIPRDFEALCNLQPSETVIREVCWLDDIAWQKWNDKLQAEGGPGAVVIGEAALVTREGRDSGTNKDLNLSHDQRLIQDYVSPEYCFSLGYLDGREMSVLFVNFFAFINKYKADLSLEQLNFIELYFVLIEKLIEYGYYQYAKDVSIISVLSIMGGLYADWDFVLNPVPKDINSIFYNQDLNALMSVKTGSDSFRKLLFLPVEMPWGEKKSDLGALLSIGIKNYHFGAGLASMSADDFKIPKQQLLSTDGELFQWHCRYQACSQAAEEDMLFKKSQCPDIQARIVRYVIFSKHGEAEISWLFDWFQGGNGYLEIDFCARKACPVFLYKSFAYDDLLDALSSLDECYRESFKAEGLRKLKAWFSQKNINPKKKYMLSAWEEVFHSHKVCEPQKHSVSELLHYLFEKINNVPTSSFKLESYLRDRAQARRYLETPWNLHDDGVDSFPVLNALFKKISHTFIETKNNHKELTREWNKISLFSPLTGQRNIAKLSSLMKTGSHSYEPLLRNVRRGMSKFQKLFLQKRLNKDIKPRSDIASNNTSAITSSFVYRAEDEFYEILNHLGIFSSKFSTSIVSVRMKDKYNQASS